MPTFSAKVFGDKLAAILDTLLAVQTKDSAQYASGPQPIQTMLGLFTSPTGESWYEADMLTRHFFAVDYSLRIALQDADIAQAFTNEDVDGAYLTMFDVRQMLQARWCVLNENAC